MPRARRKNRRGRKASSNRAGFNYYPDTATAYFEVFKPGTRLKCRLTLHDIRSKEQAEKLWDAFRAKIKGGARRPQLIAPTLQEFFDECFDTIRGRVREHTADSYEYTARKHLLPEFGKHRLSEITSGVVNRWSARLLNEGYSGATVKGYVNTLRLLLGYALRWDIIDELPIKKALDTIEVNLPCNELSLDEERRFLAAFDDEHAFRGWIGRRMPRGQVRLIGGKRTKSQKFGAKRVYGAGMRPDSDAAGLYYQRFRDAKPLFILALDTGLRRGDLLRLAWRQVDLKAGTIEIVTGKTQRKAFIPISNSCRQALIECRSKPVVGTHVFVDMDGNPVAEKTIVRYFAIAKELAGFKNRVLRFHDLRHTYATKLAREGVNIEFIAATLAHSTSRMTKRYARPGNTALNAVAAALNRANERTGDDDQESGEM